mmetsp:Transcript_60494/g.124513  ORF Transcript_60494/g.124513 Transcript_60494/m.124513 type:complete len:125 (-) Transcript_60494:306-680(-)
MKFSNKVTYSRRKNRKNHFHASSNEKRKTMVSPLSKELWKSYSIKSIPIRKDDKVKVVRGKEKGKTGKIIQCHRKNFRVFVEKITYNKNNNLTSFIPLNPSNLVVEKLSLTNERKLLIFRKKKQ